jgi:hypothetical protein
MGRWSGKHPASLHAASACDCYSSGEFSPGKLGEDTLAGKVGEGDEFICQDNRNEGVVIHMAAKLGNEMEENIEIWEVWR